MMYPNAVVFDHEMNQNFVVRTRALIISPGETMAVGMQAKMKKSNVEVFVTIKFLGSFNDCNNFKDSMIAQPIHYDMSMNNHHGMMGYDSTHMATMQQQQNVADYYEGKIQELQGQVTELTTKNETLEAEKANLEMQNNQLDTEMDDLMTQFNDLKEQLAKAQQEVLTAKAAARAATIASSASRSNSSGDYSTEFEEFRTMLKKIQSSLDTITDRPFSAVTPGGPYKKTIPLPPSNELEVDREGYQHATCSSNVRMFTRRIVALVFSFEEIFNGTVNGKKKGFGSKRSREEEEAYILSPDKINMIVDCALYHYPNDGNRTLVVNTIRNQVAKLKSGDVSAMERRKWKGFTMEAYAEKLGKPIESLRFVEKPEEKAAKLVEEQNSSNSGL